MKLILCDDDPAVVEAWRAQFALRREVEVRQCSALDPEVDAVVCPGNSFGFMDGGLALKLSERLGFGFEEGIRRTIREKHQGELLVGEAGVFPAERQPPFVVYAPTQRTPQVVKDSVNAYLAARAVFAALRDFRGPGGERIGSVACPGLCTGEGKMHPLVSARQLRYAYEEAQGLREVVSDNLSRLARREKKLKEMPLKETPSD